MFLVSEYFYKTYVLPKKDKSTHQNRYWYIKKKCFGPCSVTMAAVPWLSSKETVIRQDQWYNNKKKKIKSLKSVMDKQLETQLVWDIWECSE